MLKVGDCIKYNAGKASGVILAIRGNGKHTIYILNNGDRLLDLDQKVGKPGGVIVVPPPPRRVIDSADKKPTDLIGGGLQVIGKEIAEDLNKGPDKLNEILDELEDVVPNPGIGVSGVPVPCPSGTNLIRPSGTECVRPSPSGVSPSGV